MRFFSRNELFIDAMLTSEFFIIKIIATHYNVYVATFKIPINGKLKKWPSALIL